MPYIAFELDAMERAPEVARAIGLSVGDAAWGLLQMWRWCWREKTDSVAAIHLHGFFGATSKDPAVVLEAFGFVEKGTTSTYRVKGASRYLRLAEGRSRGGKAASKAGNLRRGKVREAGGGAGGCAGTVLETTPSTLPALSASSEQRAANTSSTADAEADAAVLELKPSPSKKVRKPSAQELLAGNLATLRAERLGPDALPDACSHSRLNKILAPLLEVEPSVLLSAYGHFLDDEYAGGCDPPYPISLFASQWAKYVSKATKESA